MNILDPPAQNACYLIAKLEDGVSSSTSSEEIFSSSSWTLLSSHWLLPFDYLITVFKVVVQVEENGERYEPGWGRAWEWIGKWELDEKGLEKREP